MRKKGIDEGFKTSLDLWESQLRNSEAVASLKDIDIISKIVESLEAEIKTINTNLMTQYIKKPEEMIDRAYLQAKCDANKQLLCRLSNQNVDATIKAIDDNYENLKNKA